jgi:hypothetical protein
MPTFGGPYEEIRERYLEAKEIVPEPGPPLPPTFICPYCKNVLASSRALQDHVASLHKVARPVLLIGGQEPKSGFAVRTQYPAGEYIVTNATRASVIIDGAPEAKIPLQDLGRKLSSIEQATVIVTLVNTMPPPAAPVASTYRMSYLIVKANVLLCVEQAFRQRLTKGRLTRSMISEFSADERCSGAGRDYAQGMAEYAMGVLIKERPEGENITSPLARYRELFGASLQRLSAYERPFARLLCSVIRFALNDLPEANSATGIHELDVASGMLRGPQQKLLITSQAGKENRQRVCPVDHGTGRILDMAIRLARQDRWSPLLNEECRQMANSALIDIMDRQKALALWAVAAWRCGAYKDSAEPLAQISAIYPFSVWANSCLETISD